MRLPKTKISVSVKTDTDVIISCYYVLSYYMREQSIKDVIKWESNVLMMLLGDKWWVGATQALTRCKKVKSRRESKIWNPYLEFREEKREMLRSVFWFKKRMRIFAKNNWEISKFSPISRREREILKTNLMIREEKETSRFQIFRDEKEKFTYHHSHSYFCFIFLLS